MPRLTRRRSFKLSDQGKFELPKAFMDSLGEGEAVVLVGMGRFIDIVREGCLREEKKEMLGEDWVDLMG